VPGFGPALPPGRAAAVVLLNINGRDPTSAEVALAGSGVDVQGTAVQARKDRGPATIFSVLAAISFCHLLNDMVQSLIMAIYPILKSGFHLDFMQVGLITLTYQMTASMLQPVVGLYTDLRPKPFSLPTGMSFTVMGLLLMSRAPNYPLLLLASALVGVGSAVFHPESSRVARMASGGQHGLAQSIFQVGGNVGATAGPLLAAFIVLPRGQHSLAWFSVASLLSMAVLTSNLPSHQQPRVKKPASSLAAPAGKVAFSIAIIVSLLFSKAFYQASLTSYYTFYLISKFHVSVQSAQVHLFVFWGSIAAGALVGGPVGDRIGRKFVIWYSILGVLPFTLVLPYASLFWTEILIAVIGFILSSSMSAIVVYAQELVPGRVGTMAGLSFGLSFGLGGLGAALLGKLADVTSIYFVYSVCSFLPAIGLLTAFLPNLETAERGQREEVAG
jgi:FSR family fosmidomycin resistance protein-like MFS transporter